MKRIISLTLSVFMLLSLIVTVSCSSQTAEEFDLDLETDLPVDLTGQHYVWGSTWYEQLLPSEYFNQTGDMTHKRLNDLTEKYGCTFDVISWEDSASRIIIEAAAGYSSIDFLDSHATNGGINLYRSGLLYSLDEIPNIDLSDNRFGTPRFLQYGIFDGRYYGFYQYAWEFPPEFHGVIHFNADMLRKLGLNTPHELHENGEWDWAHFKEFLMSVQSAASYASYDSDFIPFICGSSYDADAVGFMFANGLKMIDGTNGNYVFGFNNPAGIAAIEFLADLYNEGLYIARGHAEFVKNKKSALMSHESNFSTHYNEKSSSSNYLPAQDYAYGMIRFPYGPNGDANCVSGYVHHGRRLNWILNCTDKDVADIGLVLNYVFAPLDGSTGWEGLLKNQIFYFQEDLDEYSYMLENINFSYGSLFLEKGYTTWAGNVVAAVTGRKTASEVFDSANTAIQEAINKNVTWTIDELIK